MTGPHKLPPFSKWQYVGSMICTDPDAVRRFRLLYGRTPGVSVRTKKAAFRALGHTGSFTFAIARRKPAQGEV